jgi:hypothetical protein
MPTIAAVQSLIRSVTIPWGAKSTPLNIGLASNTEVVTLRAHKQRLYLFQSPGNPQWQARTLMRREAGWWVVGEWRVAAASALPAQIPSSYRFLSPVLPPVRTCRALT